MLSTTCTRPCRHRTHFWPKLWLLSVALIFLVAANLVQSFDASDSLSPRSVSTKYGLLRGAIVYFKTYDRNFGSKGTPASQSSSSSSTASSSSSSNSKTSSGQVPPNGPNLKPVEMFLGIPYATPPVGSLRFMPPVTPTHWRGVRLANRFGPVCPQKLPNLGLRNPKNSGSFTFPSPPPSSGSSSSSTSSAKGKSSSSGKYSSSSSTSSSSASSSSSSSSSNSSSSPSSSSYYKDLPEGRLAFLKRITPFLRNQSEDCLYLNIYVPFPQTAGGGGGGGGKLLLKVVEKCSTERTNGLESMLVTLDSQDSFANSVYHVALQQGIQMNPLLSVTCSPFIRTASI